MWGGFILSLFAFLSYYLIFVWFPVTRDFPWANFLLIGVALVVLFFGFKRAFAPDRSRASKVIASIFGTLGVLVCVMFVGVYFVFAKWIPAASGAPQVGQKAPEFTLTDSNNQQVSLNQLLTTPINGKPPKGVVLVFYRGYW
jgi:hypothetical protein